MKILRCIRSLDPALGGTVEAVRQACQGLPELGHSVEVVCLDAPYAPWLLTFPAKVHALGPAQGTYGYSGRFVRWMREQAGEYDAVIVDGLWQFPGWGTWLALRKSTTPYYVYTHGMLSPWFKQNYPLKHIKKWIYWTLAEYWVLREARAVLFTCEQEKALARESFWLYKAREAVAGLGVETTLGDPFYQRQLFLKEFPALQGKRLLLFLGRIHPKKGCDLLIEAFAKVSFVDSSLHLVFVGPDKIGWRQELQLRIVELELESKVTWTGMLSGDFKWGAFNAAEAFVLPSHSENFGTTIAEAMSCGVPVLITNKVDIWQEVEETGGGLVRSDDLKGVVNLLDSWLTLKPDEREAMKVRAQRGFAEKFSLHAALECLISVLRSFDTQGNYEGR